MVWNTVQDDFHLLQNMLYFPLLEFDLEAISLLEICSSGFPGDLSK